MLGFTPEQIIQAEALAGQLGVLRCRRQIENFHRKYADEMLGRARPTDAGKREFNSFAFPCMLKLDDYLGRLPGLLNAGQQQVQAVQIQQLRKDLAARKKIHAPTYPGIY